MTSLCWQGAFAPLTSEGELLVDGALDRWMGLAVFFFFIFLTFPRAWHLASSKVILLKRKLVRVPSRSCFC